MSYRVRTDSFEGPFDLLLYLVTKDRVDIGSVSIADIADQYLKEINRLKSLDLDVASDFLLVASTLLELKAHHLIPQESIDLDDEVSQLDPNEAREVLVSKLIEYKTYKNAALMLESRMNEQAKQHNRSFGPDAVFLQAMPDFLHGVTLDGLAVLAAEAYAHQDIVLLESEHIAAKPIPVELHVRALQARLRKSRSLTFSEMLEDHSSPAIVVVTFLAILELYKRSLVSLQQENMFGEIRIVSLEDERAQEAETSDMFSNNDKHETHDTVSVDSVHNT